MKFSRIMILVAAGALMGGCSKVLDKTSKVGVNEEETWKDLDLATAFADRIHAKSLPEWSTEFAGYSEEANGGDGHMYGQLTENSVDFWPYNPIRDCNILLTNVDNGTLGEDQRKWLKGQAFLFRGWQYWELVKRYGGVPLILKAQTTSDDLYVPRSKTSEVMKQIMADLDSAISYLPAVSAGATDKNNGRVHRATALAIKGRIALFYASPQFDPPQSAAGRWQAAYDANKAAKELLDVQGFGLFSNFTGIWYTEMNKEVIFVRRYQYNSANSASWNNWAAATRPLDISQGATNANRPTVDEMEAFPMKDGKAITDLSGTYTYDPVYYWKNRDPRFDQTFVYNGALYQTGAKGLEPGRIQWTFKGGEANAPTPTGFYMRKMIDTAQGSLAASNSSTDWVELRYAEVLLNLAEAANEVGKPEEAYPLLTAIRARAGISAGVGGLYGLAPGMDKAQLRNAILLERQLELAYEAKRFWDLRRWRLFESLLNGKKRRGHDVALKTMTVPQWNTFKSTRTPQELLNLMNTDYTTYFTTTVKVMDPNNVINWKPNYYFYAIPLRHIQSNPNIAQTNGWAGGNFDPLQ